jgi:hypothetical protein
MVWTVSDGVDLTDLLYVKVGPDNSYADGGLLIGYDDASWVWLTTDYQFYIYGTETGGAPSKASSPSPADASGPGINFETPTLSWSGDGDTYDVYGGAAGNFVLLSSGQAGTSYTLSEADKVLFKNGVVTWRVDSTNDEGTTQGDDWTFDPRPAKVTTPAPAHTATGQSIYSTMGWAASTYATSYDVWWLGSKIYSETTEVVVLPLVADLPMDYGTVITWRVDSNNYYGTTTGDTWTFTTLAWDPPHVSVRLLSDGSVASGPFDPLTMYPTGENFVAGMRRLLVFCGSSLWYENIDST